MIIFAGVDGTSSEKGTEEIPGSYQETFRDSFVNRLHRNELVRFNDTWYLRGPYTNRRGKRYYIVQPGDWLSKIAEKYYGDIMKYKPLHKANLEVIGPDPNKIEPRQKLWIPYPDELSRFN